MRNLSNKGAILIMVVTFFVGAVLIYSLSYGKEISGPKETNGNVVTIKDYYIDGGGGSFAVDINHDGKSDVTATTDDFGFAKEIVESINNSVCDSAVSNGKNTSMVVALGVPVQIVKVWNGITPYYKLLPIGVKSTASN